MQIMSEGIWCIFSNNSAWGVLFSDSLFPCLLPPVQREHGNSQPAGGRECLRMKYRVKDKVHDPVFPPLTAGCDVMLSCHGSCSLLLVLPQELQLPAGR